MLCNVCVCIVCVFDKTVFIFSDAGNHLTVNFDKVVFIGNSAENAGGGVVISGLEDTKIDVSISNSLFIANHATVYGGAIGIGHGNFNILDTHNQNQPNITDGTLNVVFQNVSFKLNEVLTDCSAGAAVVIIKRV